MEEELRDMLKVLPEEEMEFYTRGLIAMLRKQVRYATIPVYRHWMFLDPCVDVQQSLNRIPDMKFNRKFTSLFRLYKPLILECYDRPNVMLKAYLTWENSFFSKIALCHHRDAAREKHMPDICRLVDADDETIASELSTVSEALLKKLEAQRLKDAELKAKRQQKKGAKKKKPTVMMTEDESNAVLRDSLALRRYCTDTREALLETAALCEQSQDWKREELSDEQVRAQDCLNLVLQTSSKLQEKSASASPANIASACVCMLARGFRDHC
jgi:hypothetical protein